MGNGKHQADLVKACALAHGVSDRSVRNWRDARDPRWIAFLAERAVSGSGPSENSPAESETEPLAAIAGTGLDYEIIRLKSECLALARRARAALTAQDLDAEMALNRMLDAKRETLRRLEKDTPGIQADARDTLPRIPVEQAFVTYCAEIKARLQQLPDRVLSLLPSDLATGLRAKILDEIEAIQRSAAEIKLTA